MKTIGQHFPLKPFFAQFWQINIKDSGLFILFGRR